MRMTAKAKHARLVRELQTACEAYTRHHDAFSPPEVCSPDCPGVRKVLHAAMGVFFSQWYSGAGINGHETVPRLTKPLSTTKG